MRFGGRHGFGETATVAKFALLKLAPVEER
jgi:hypothetical protein